MTEATSNTATISASVPPALYEELRRVGYEKRVPMSRIVSEALAIHLKRPDLIEGDWIDGKRTS